MSDSQTPSTGAEWGDQADVVVDDPGAAVERRQKQPEEFTVVGGDWQNLPDTVDEDYMVINMGPQHPSTHGVLRMVLTLDGEKVLDNEPVIGYLHTGIEKNIEVRPWVLGTTFVTRMDYLAPMHTELAYCLATEKLLGITDDIPDRANAIRVLVTELNRVASHFVWLATGGMELGSTTAMIYGFRERDTILDLFEELSGLRMNHAYIRPGGIVNDLPPGFIERCRDVIDSLRYRTEEMETLLTENPIWIERLTGVGVLTREECLDWGVTGPVLRSTGIAHDLRKTDPYSGIEQYDFTVPVNDMADAYGRYLLRLEEIRQSLNISEQVLDTLPGGPVMVEDKSIAWPSQLALGPDGLGNAEEHISKIMGKSMEALIHHFKLVTEGFAVPEGQVYSAVESPRGEIGVHATSNGTNKPYRVKVREPSFIHIGALPAMSCGGDVADVIVAVASMDPVMGGCDR